MACSGNHPQAEQESAEGLLQSGWGANADFKVALRFSWPNEEPGFRLVCNLR